jgi:hypothetical protein
LTADSQVSHENYVGVSTWFDYDISVVLLNNAYTLGSTVAIINIPLQDQKVNEGTLGVASGWGRLRVSGLCWVH